MNVIKDVNKDKVKTIRKVYMKPTLSIIRLAAEEAVLGNCKEGTGLGARVGCQSGGDQTCLSTGRS